MRALEEGGGGTMTTSPKFPYKGYSTFEEYRKDLNAMKLYELMERLKFPEHIQKALITGDYKIRQEVDCE